MKHLKTIAAILIAALALTGCSKNQTSTSNDSEASSAQSDASDNSIGTSDTSSSTASTAENPSAPESKPESSLPSSSGTTETSEPEEPVYQTEFEQALAVLKNYVYFDFALRPFDLFFPEGIVDKTQYIIENATYDENSKPIFDSESIFYKVIGGSVRTEEQFNKLLDDTLTEKFKQAYCENSYRGFRFKDGDLYVGGSGARGRNLGMSYLELNSFEHLDDNTILMKVTSVGDKEDWGLNEDIRDEATIKFIKSADGKLRLDECNDQISHYFWLYDDIVYGDISISLGPEPLPNSPESRYTTVPG